MRKITDMAGKRYGSLLVKTLDGSVGGKAYWLCECDCGKISRISGSNIRSGQTKSCGCAGHSSRTTDISGKTFGKLLVSNEFKINEKHQVYWKCKCLACNSNKLIISANLRYGLSQTCGCGMYKSTKGKKYPFDKKIYRSRYELIFGCTLKALKIKFKYEPKIFDIILPNNVNCKYIPDFFIPSKNLWIETKGYICNESIKKFTSFPLNKKLITETELSIILGKPIRSFYNKWKKENYDNSFLIHHIKQQISSRKSEIESLILSQ